VDEQRPTAYAPSAGTHPTFSAEELVQAAYMAGDHPVLLVEWESRRILACNEAVQRVFGYRPDELRGCTTAQLHVSGGAYRSFGERSQSLIGAHPEHSYHGHFWMRRRDGSTFPSENLVLPILDDVNGTPRAVISIVRDLGETTAPGLIGTAESGFIDLHALTANLPGIVFQRVRTRDGEDRLTWLSGALDPRIDLDADARTDPARFEASIHPLDRQNLQRALDQSEHTLTPIDLQIRYHQHDRGYTWLRVIAQPRRLDDASTAWDGLALDITHEKSAEAEAHFLATHDALTGLPNRAHFLEGLDAAIHAGTTARKRIALVQIDVHRMFHINESYGFAAGDALLRDIGQRLGGRLKPQDVVARSHSDVFLAMLAIAETDVDLSAALHALQEAFAEPFPLEDGSTIRAEARFGISTFPEDGTTADELLRASGVALDRSRQSDDQGYEFYSQPLGEQLRTRIRREEDLRGAIERHEIVPHYQPQVGLEDGRIVGFEALARWTSASGEVVSPGDFIPLAEETGLIHALGHQVLEQVATQIRDWRERGIDVPPVAVNCSARQFRVSGFFDTCRECLARSGIPHELVRLEITESSILDDFESTRATMERLSDLGVRFSIDDFGTGFSSLSYLARLPFHTLKIDRAFVSALGTDDRQGAIVEALVWMGRALGLYLVAEGVETEAQAEQLRALGCDAAQGWMYAPGLPADELGPWLGR